MNGNDQDILMFGSCDYLGLNKVSKIAEASSEAILKYGTTTQGPQIQCGRTELHAAVEDHLARIYGTESALLFPAGMLANQAVLQTLAGPEDVIINDQANHVSLLMGARLSGARIRYFPHNHTGRLEEILAETEGARRRVIVVDGLFSVDGDFAPLDEIVGLAHQYRAQIVVDEAHSFGAVGPNGLGVADYFGLIAQVDVIVGTMSKAAASVGGYAVMNAAIGDAIRFAPAYTSSLGSPPAVAAASRAALEHMDTHGPELRGRLETNARHATDRLRRAGFNLMTTRSHVIPVLIGSEDTTLAVARWLMDHGVYLAPFIHPAVPRRGERLRIAITAAHTTDQIDLLCHRLEEAREAIAGWGRP